MRATMLVMSTLAMPALALAAPRVEKPEYVVELVAPKTIEHGQAATATVRVSTRAGYHVNGEYPTSFRLDASAGVTTAQKSVDKKQFALAACAAPHAQDACSAEAKVAFTVDKAGDAKVSGVVAFGVCDAERCLIEKVAVDAAMRAR